MTGQRVSGLRCGIALLLAAGCYFAAGGCTRPEGQHEIATVVSV